MGCGATTATHRHIRHTFVATFMSFIEDPSQPKTPTQIARSSTMQQGGALKDAATTPPLPPRVERVLSIIARIERRKQEGTP
jgi:hypothetical protein